MVERDFSHAIRTDQEVQDHVQTDLTLRAVPLPCTSEANMKAR